MRANKVSKIFAFLFFIALLFSGCTKDTIVPIDIEDKIFSFSEDIEPMLLEKCSATSCHGGSVSPNLSVNAYQALLNGGLIIPGKYDDDAKESGLYQKLNGSHNDGRTTTIVKRSIELWMEQGAEDN